MSIVAAYVVVHPSLRDPKAARSGAPERAGLGSSLEEVGSFGAFREVARRIGAHAPETVIAISPRAPRFRDCFHLATGEAALVDEAPSRAFAGAVRNDEALVASVAACARKHAAPICGSGMGDARLDSATAFLLPFFAEALGGARVVRVGVSDLPSAAHLALGRCIAEAARDLDRKCVLVAIGSLDGEIGVAASGDARGAARLEGTVLARGVAALLDAGDLEGLLSVDPAYAEAAGACALRPLQVMAGALEGAPFTHELLGREAPTGAMRLAAAFEVRGAQGDGAVSSPVDAQAAARKAVRQAIREEGADPYAALAKASVEGLARTGGPIDRPAHLPSELMDERAGVFVSLRARAGLRGRAGTFEPVTGCVADEIMRNAASAATDGALSAPVSPCELEGLSYVVDVLRPAMPVGSVSELDPARWGVAVSKGRRRGVALPGLEGVGTAREQIELAKRSAGIDLADDDVELERFETVRHTASGILDG
ncbi:hypothetical protein B5F40_11890 [Gordonibacter sp. An230]|uniref:AMMECR1 domain-containing protein n=1 Tax=Gordonibacter sp. An230 TaxID=1965592 RepID=UPI000B381BD2|nr:AMMECR1 domain-containing protein [Gordonibacter sp. An230]OUO88906.1 hypothetical protein B5F40_11890 [Gordonibacter sp. An230]